MKLQINIIENDIVKGQDAALLRLGRMKNLKPREVAALAALAKCLIHKAIASEIGVSVALEKKIIRKVYAKLGVSGRLEAILFWRSQNQI